MKDNSHLNGRDGWGYQPKPPTPPPPPPSRLYNSFGVRLDRPSTTERQITEHNQDKIELMAVYTFCGFMFCSFCMGIAIGSLL